MEISCLSLNEIKRRLKGAPELEPAVLDALRRDSRAGVRALYRRIAGRMERDAAEIARIKAMYRREHALAGPGVVPIAGVDEAGRGPIAGPVAAAAVVLPRGQVITGLNDSKKITPARRMQVAAEIMETALAWSVAMASVQEIKKYNILGATFLAMRRAVRRLGVEPAWLLVDGNMAIPDVAVPQTAVVNGDAVCASVAAASVLAKVRRDELMVCYDRRFPGYGFARHKGYGTAQHYDCLRRLGPTPIHRDWPVRRRPRAD